MLPSCPRTSLLSFTTCASRLRMRRIAIPSEASFVRLDLMGDAQPAWIPLLVLAIGSRLGHLRRPLAFLPRSAGPCPSPSGYRGTAHGSTLARTVDLPYLRSLYTLSPRISLGPCPCKAQTAPVVRRPTVHHVTPRHHLVPSEVKRTVARLGS